MKRFGGSLLAAVVAMGLLLGTSGILQVQAAPTKNQGKFYLKDGDRVVFYGDSITDQKLYTTYIETYCLTRFPNKHFTFVHSGWGGDRVTGGGGGPIDVRLKRDVLAYKPTVVTICLGMNDASYRPFDQKIFDTYVNGYRHILDTLIKELPGVRITLLTAPAFDDVTRPVSFPGGYNAVLVAYGEAVQGLAKEYGLTVADTNSPLVGAMARANTLDKELAPKIIPDRVHPGFGGHLIMASAVLKAWNAPETVADIEIDASSEGQVTKQENTRISDLKAAPVTISFTLKDNALPWAMDRNPDSQKDTLLSLAVTDIEQTLNRYNLRVTGLPGGSYTLRVDGVDLGKVSVRDLDKGVNLAAFPQSPVNVQTQEVLNLTRKHNDLHFRRWRIVPKAKDGFMATPDIQKEMDDLDAQEAKVIPDQRAAAKPKTHRVELTSSR